MLSRLKCISKQLNPKLSMHSQQNLMYDAALPCPTEPSATVCGNLLQQDRAGKIQGPMPNYEMGPFNLEKK